MATNPIKLAVNRQTRSLTSWLGAVTTIPDLYQSNVQDFQVQVVDPDPTTLGGYTVVDLLGVGLRMAVGPQPTGTQGGPAVLALTDSTGWTWDPVNKWFTGNLALNNTNVDSYIGAAASALAWFELNLTTGNRQTIYQTTFTLKAVLDELTSTTPNPTDQYLTKGECLAIFQKLIGDYGQRLVLRSNNQSWGLELGVNDDGSIIENVIPNP